MINFVKYHGTGNDFIMVDDRNSLINLDTATIRLMCDRHFGIGADGLILIRMAKGFDFEMVYYNSDGNRSSMCGNGGRCSVAFAAELGLIDSTVNFLAFDGPHRANIVSTEPYSVILDMNDVNSVEVNEHFLFLNTGSPHYVEFRNDVEKMDVHYEGKKIRYSERFAKEGTNVNFVKVSEGKLFVRTYERGVEAETLSCGTGVTASAIAAVHKGLINVSEEDTMPIEVETPGGKLFVYFNGTGKDYFHVKLHGPAIRVFSGVYPDNS